MRNSFRRAMTEQTLESFSTVESRLGALEARLTSLEARLRLLTWLGMLNLVLTTACLAQVLMLH
jgi:hypothetical protein